ncbi:MAG: TolC family outer membrane protein [Oleiphilaceae bacterium]|nr:TolC family outer membrane protein [Oleiphilaceae bacterium]
MCRFFCIILLLLYGVELHATSRSIAESVTLSLSQHPAVRAQLAQVAQASADLEVVEAEFLPQIRLTAGIGREDSNNASTRASGGGASEELERRESGITLRQMLFDGYQTHWQRQSSLSQKEAAQADLEDELTRTALDAVARHLELATAAQVVELHFAHLQRHQKIANDVDARTRSGRDDRAKLSQVAARLALSQANLSTAKEQLSHAQASYREITGATIPHTLLWQDGLVKLPDSLEQFKTSVLAENPRLIGERARNEAAQDAWKAAKHHQYPKLFLESGANWQDNVDGVKGLNRDAYAMLRVHYDLYQGGADKARQRRTRLQHHYQQQQVEVIRRAVIMDAERAWSSYQEQGRRYNHLQNFVEAAEQTRSAYEKQFEIGQRRLIDLLDAENEVLRARSESLQARRQLYLTKYTLLALQNKLLDSLEVHGHLQLSIYAER